MLEEVKFMKKKLEFLQNPEHVHPCFVVFIVLGFPCVQFNDGAVLMVVSLN